MLNFEKKKWMAAAVFVVAAIAGGYHLYKNKAVFVERAIANPTIEKCSRSNTR